MVPTNLSHLFSGWWTLLCTSGWLHWFCNLTYVLWLFFPYRTVVTHDLFIYFAMALSFTNLIYNQYQARYIAALLTLVKGFYLVSGISIAYSELGFGFRLDYLKFNRSY